MSSAETLWNEGRELHSNGKFLEAADKYTNVILAPGEHPRIKSHALNNLAIILQGLGHMDKAAAALVYAQQMNPDCAEILNNFGNCRLYLGDYAGANAYFLKAIAKNPKAPDARLNSAVIALLTGDLPRGWREYEWRWKVPTFSTKPFKTNKPRWKGQSFKGKTLLLTHEQGFGDSIMFSRYFPAVKERGGRVLFVGPPELECILTRVRGLDEYLTYLDGAEFDFHCPLLSLPNLFNTRLGNIPSEVPYIDLGGDQNPSTSRECALPACRPINASGTHMIAPGDGAGHPNHGVTKSLKVGIAWAGRPEHGKDKWRSTKLEQWKDLLSVPGVEWFSFQVGKQAGQVKDFPHVTDLSPQIKDYLDTAHLLQGIDLLISVDTSVVHLAGALAKPVWMLTPYNPDWRWLLETETSEWYPQMRLFRQPAIDDWASVFERVRKELCTFA